MTTKRTVSLDFIILKNRSFNASNKLFSTPFFDFFQFLIDFHKRPLYFDFPQDLMNEHGVSKGEESVTLFDSHVVGVQDIFPAGQSGNQHNQRALRQMKISN